MIKSDERKEGCLYDPKALAYYSTCPRCHETHIATSHNIAIGGTDWHKPNCPFINPGGLYTVFSAYPIYHKRHKIFRQLDKKWQQFFIDEQEKRLKTIKEQEELCQAQNSQAKKSEDQKSQDDKNQKT